VSLFRGERSKKGMQKGLTMVEIMVTLLLTTIIMGILYVVLTSTFKISGQVQTQLAIDEEIMKLNSGLGYIISRNWTAIDFDESDLNTISLKSRFPNIGDETVATVTYLNGELLFLYNNSSNEQVSSVIAADLEDFEFEFPPDSSHIYYDATFTVSGITKPSNGAVKIY